jgi:hypothetical protein
MLAKCITHLERSPGQQYVLMEGGTDVGHWLTPLTDGSVPGGGAAAHLFGAV